MRPLAMITILILTLFGSSMPTAAQDEQPCGEPWWHNAQQQLVQDCELWTAPVPVVAGIEGEAATQVVGELVSASGNWFSCQVEGVPGSVPGTEYANTWWAKTLADNGQWGYVNEAYFAGGDNNEPDGNLARCTDADGVRSDQDHAAEKAEEQRRRDEAAEQAFEYEWSDCIWGDAPEESVVATFTEKDGTGYTLQCGNGGYGVVHIKEGHGFTDRTIPCIARVLSEYDSRERSSSNPTNDVFRLKAEITGTVGNYFDAKVVVDRTHRNIVTAYVETYALGDLPEYDVDPWDACSPVPTTA